MAIVTPAKYFSKVGRQVEFREGQDLERVS
jgi:hypothetical protein